MEAVLRYVRSNKATLFCHHAGFGMINVAALAAGTWIPEMFRRDFHWDIPTIGFYYGVMVLVFGSVGCVSAGRIADWLRARSVLNANMRVATWVALLNIPLSFGWCLAPNGKVALMWLAPWTMLIAAPWGIAAAAIQQVMPTLMRGRASALYVAVTGLTGMGIGPTAAAVCTQYLFRRDDAVNYSLLLVCGVALMAAAALLWISSKAFLGSLDRLRVWSAANSEEGLKTGV
jgi:MFS family permease